MLGSCKKRTVSAILHSSTLEWCNFSCRKPQQEMLHLETDTIQCGISSQFRGKLIAMALSSDRCLEADGARRASYKDSRTITEKDSRTITEKDSRTITEKDSRTNTDKDSRTITEKDSRTITEKDSRTITDKDSRTITENKKDRAEERRW
ncbi:hypothetical protein RRG08_065115 [Elysia crispata]|uniref:Uncharacterized protein n=1 Tax=Elysia crispata TaxID=231223 RepID=A0AAE1DC78_9GAST|nr:hypothetical protein RRG08_065115 [Elysia crispata]